MLLISHEIYRLHLVVFWVCVAIAAGVFSVMIYAVIHHRKLKDVKPAMFHKNTILEVVWTVIPLLIFVGMAIPAVRVLMKMNDSNTAAINDKVGGYQWKAQPNE